MTPEHTILTLKAFARYLKHRRIPKAKGNRVIIAGNGPSLEGAIENHLHLLESSPVFCVNHFANTPDFLRVKPQYYAIMDPVFTLQNCAPRYLEDRDALFASIQDKTKWDMHLFFPLYPGQMILEKRLSSSYLKLHSCNIFPPITIPKVRNLAYRSGLLMPPPQNVLVAAIYLCLNMGYTEIYLLGAEHSWTQDMLIKEDNMLYTINRHFTGISQETPWKKGESDGTWKMHEILKALHKTFHSYHLLKEYADSRNAVIYNATPDSFIDAFERKDILTMDD